MSKTCVKLLLIIGFSSFVNNINAYAYSELIHIKFNLMFVLCMCFVSHLKIEN